MQLFGIFHIYISVLLKSNKFVKGQVVCLITLPVQLTQKKFAVHGDELHQRICLNVNEEQLSGAHVLKSAVIINDEQFLLGF